MEVFQIKIRHDYKHYTFSVEQLPGTKTFDQYKLIAKNKTMTLQNNAPVLRRYSSKHRAPDWKIIDGAIWNNTFTDLVIKAINKHLGYI